MDVYRFAPDSDKYDCLDNLGDWTMLWNGKPQAASWEPVSVPYYARQSKKGDFPHLEGPVPVFSETAWGILRPQIGKSVEALPLVCDTEMIPQLDGSRKIISAGPFGPYFAINVLDIVDCLDVDQSDITRLSMGAVIHVSSYAFKFVSLEGKHMFKLPETKALEVLVSDDFKRLVESNGLKGLKFTKLGTID